MAYYELIEALPQRDGHRYVIGEGDTMLTDLAAMRWVDVSRYTTSRSHLYCDFCLGAGDMCTGVIRVDSVVIPFFWGDIWLWGAPRTRLSLIHI